MSGHTYGVEVINNGDIFSCLIINHHSELPDLDLKLPVRC